MGDGHKRSPFLPPVRPSFEGISTRVERIERGETVKGGLGKATTPPLTIIAVAWTIEMAIVVPRFMSAAPAWWPTSCSPAAQIRPRAGITLARRHDSAVLELGKAIELNPSFAQAHYALSMALATGGRPEEALPHIELAMRLSPQDPYFGQFLVRRAEACLFLGRLEEAVEAAERSLREPNIQWSRWAILAAAQAHLGKLKEARNSIEALQILRPGIDLAFARDYWPIADAKALEYLMDGLRRAGLPSRV
jgi:hypothetical protein